MKTKDRGKESSGSLSSVLVFVKRVVKEREWAIIGIIAFIGVLLGFIGFGRYFSHYDRSISDLDRLYFTFQLIGMEFNYIGDWIPWELQVARFLLPILTIYTIGRAVLSVFRSQLNLIRIRLMRGHIIVCGLGEKGSFIAKDLLKSGDDVVCVEIDDDSPEVQNIIDLGGKVVIGDAANEGVLSRAGIRKASDIIVTCDDESTNVEVAKKAFALKRGRSLTATVHIKDMQFCPMVEQGHVGARSVRHKLRFFNVFESGARQLLRSYPPDTFERPGEDIDVLIIGFGPLGENLVLQLLRVGHYSNDRKLNIGVADDRVKKKGRIFKSRYRGLENIHDITLRFIDVDMDASGRFDPDLITPSGSVGPDVIYVCLEDDSRSQSCALNINRRPRGVVSPIVINFIQNTGFERLLASEKNPYLKDNELHLFSPIRKACSKDVVLKESLDSIAVALHENYRKLRMDPGKSSKRKKVDMTSDPALLPWEELPENLKESNRQSADHIDIKLRTVGCRRKRFTYRDKVPEFEFNEEEVEILGKMEHNRWNAERFLDGWKLGNTKDPARKISPYLRRWESPELSEDIKDYDREFVRIIPKILARAYPSPYGILRKKKGNK